jgi:alpha-1,3-rhamnosyl/mannosyltransferase
LVDPFGAPRPALGLLVGGDSLIGRRTGVGRMTAQIVDALRRTGDIHRMLLSVGSGFRSVESLDAPAAAEIGYDERSRLSRRLRGVASAAPLLPQLRAALNRRRFAAAAQAIGRDCPGGVAYWEPNAIAKPFAGPTVVTINDVSWRFDPQFHPRDRVAWIERRLPASLAQAGRIVAISRFTATELAREYAVDPARIDVAPLAATSFFKPMSAHDAAPGLARSGLRDRGYILAVSTLEPRKNFDRLFSAYESLPDTLRARFPLAIIGGAGWGDVLAGGRTAQAVSAGRLRLLGYRDDLELASLFARAAVFAFPSLYEGFGLPVLEAMAAGAPVVASSTTAVGEVAAGAALLVDPLDEKAIADAIRRAIEDTVLAADLRRRGLARAAEFSWDRTAAELIASVRRAIVAG